MRFSLITCLLLALTLTACGDSKERIPADAPGYVKGKPVHPTIKIGRAYEVLGGTYYPKYDPLYDETGEASWYGPNFHGKSTANGERYNQWAMTAAHKTLPMPSMVKVTHMKTGKTITVRVNDRGPFSDGRIIDLSRGAAEALGMIAEGVAPVRVQYLKDDTERYIAKLQLKKPDDWTQTDIMLAQQGESEVQITQSAPIPAVQMGELEPAAHPPVKEADEVPDLFAYNAPVPQETTVEARGLEMKEIGYAENAFSILSNAEAAEPSAQPYQSASLDGVSPYIKTSYKPASTHANISGVRYYVQAATFGEQANAAKLANKLTSLAAVDISTIQNNNGRTLYRVRLGPTGSDAVAYELVSRLKEHGIHDAQVQKE